MTEFADQLTPLNVALTTGIVWLSGVFVWLIRKFMSSYEQNTKAMTKVSETLGAMDRKLEASVDRDVEIIKMLAEINATRPSFTTRKERVHG